MKVQITLPTFTMDDTWSVFDGVTNNLEDFIVKFMPDLFLRPEVNKDVHENFRVVRKLIECSYFEFKIYDVGALKAVLTMEMALRLRYEELQNVKWPANKPLHQLIKWLEERNYFEAYSPYYMDNMRKVRNILAHPHQHTFGGSSTAPLIERIVDIVNGLYENPDLRITRKLMTLKITEVINSFSGRMIIEYENQKHYAYRAWPAFINNKNNSLEIHFYFKPICSFSDQYLENNQWTWSPVYYFKANDIDIASKQLTLRNNKSEILVVQGITELIDLEEFNNWKTKYGALCDQTGELINSKEGIVDPFFIHLREFHRML